MFQPHLESGAPVLPVVAREREFLTEMNAKARRLQIIALGEILAGEAQFEPSNSQRRKAFAVTSEVILDSGESTFIEQHARIRELFTKYIPIPLRIAGLENLHRSDLHLFADLGSRALERCIAPLVHKDLAEALFQDLARFRGDLVHQMNEGLFGCRDPLESNRFEIKIRNQWIRFVRRSAELLCGSNRYSPAHASTGIPERGFEQQASSGTTDYQRCGSELLVKFESELARDLGRPICLFDSGMGAFHSILLAIEAMQPSSFESGARILEVGSLYWEIDQKLENVAAKRSISLTQVAAGNFDLVLDMIRFRQPEILILGSIANSLELGVSNVIDLLSRIGSSDEIAQQCGYDAARKRLFVIIDETVAAQLPQWPETSSRLPGFITVVTFESLVKLYQDGLDLAQLAAVTCDNSLLQLHLRLTRKFEAHLPTERAVSEVRCAWDPASFAAKLRRHSDNALFLAQRMSAWVEQNCAGKIRVNYPFLPSHPHYGDACQALRGGGPLVTVSFPGAASRSEVWVNRLIDFAITRALERGLELNKGTGFGFNITRFIHCSETRPLGNPDASQPRYLRIASGTESAEVVTLLAEVFEYALQQLWQQISVELTPHGEHKSETKGAEGKSGHSELGMASAST